MRMQPNKEHIVRRKVAKKHYKYLSFMIAMYCAMSGFEEKK